MLNFLVTLPTITAIKNAIITHMSISIAICCTLSMFIFLLRMIYYLFPALITVATKAKPNKMFNATMILIFYSYAMPPFFLIAS